MCFGSKSKGQAAPAPAPAAPPPPSGSTAADTSNAAQVKAQRLAASDPSMLTQSAGAFGSELGGSSGTSTMAGGMV